MIKVNLSADTQAEVDASAYMAELRSEVEQLRGDLTRSREASQEAQGGGLLAYIQSIGREKISDLTSSISEVLPPPTHPSHPPPSHTHPAPNLHGYYLKATRHVPCATPGFRILYALTRSRTSCRMCSMRCGYSSRTYWRKRAWGESSF